MSWWKRLLLRFLYLGLPSSTMPDPKWLSHKDWGWYWTTYEASNDQYYRDHHGAWTRTKKAYRELDLIRACVADPTQDHPTIHQAFLVKWLRRAATEGRSR